jgi:hypothetical protein
MKGLSTMTARIGDLVAVFPFEGSASMRERYFPAPVPLPVGGKSNF